MPRSAGGSLEVWSRDGLVLRSAGGSLEVWSRDGLVLRSAGGSLKADIFSTKPVASSISSDMLGWILPSLDVLGVPASVSVSWLDIESSYSGSCEPLLESGCSPSYSSDISDSVRSLGTVCSPSSTNPNLVLLILEATRATAPFELCAWSGSVLLGLSCAADA